MIRTAAIFLLCVLIGIGWVISAHADTAAQNPVEWLARLETEAVGQVGTGSLFDRLSALEETINGRTYDGALVERLTRLDNLLFTNQPNDVSLIYKAQALEWVLYREVSAGSLITRLQRLEKELLGTAQDGSLTKRYEKLVQQIFTDGTIKGHWANVPEGTLIKLRMIDKLSSVNNSSGDKFKFVVAETVYDQNYILFPKGITGVGVVAQVTRPANLGRDARLILDFPELKALDGTPVKIYYGMKAQEMNRSRQLAVGASAAGMLAAGPGGILFGLAIRGRETTIPAGTEFFIQVKEPVRIYTLER